MKKDFEVMTEYREDIGELGGVDFKGLRCPVCKHQFKPNGVRETKCPKCSFIGMKGG